MGRVIKKTGDFLNHITSFGGYLSAGSTRFLRFATSNSFTLIIDIIVLTILVEYIFGIKYYLLSAALSFTISNTVNYTINRNWSFKGTATNVFKGYFLFISLGTFGLLLTLFLMWLFVDVLSFYYIFARIIVAAIEGTLSFVLNSFITFKMPFSFNALRIKKDKF